MWTPLVLGVALAAQLPDAPPLPDPVAPIQDVQTDFGTVLAISSTVYLTSALLHEGLGHAGACALSGGRAEGFSLANAGCSPHTRGEKAAGALLGNGVGALATGIPLMVAPPRRNGATYYALWLNTLVNLQQIGGYMMVGAWLPVGDWGTEGVLEGQSFGAQLAVSLTGLGLTAATIPLAHHWGRPLFGDDLKAAQPRRRLLTWTPWLVGSSLVVGGSLLNRAGPEFAVSAALSTFTGTLALAYMPLFFSDPVFAPKGRSKGAPLAIRRQKGWWVVGGLVAVGAVAAFGPGIGRYPKPHPLDPR